MSIRQRQLTWIAVTFAVVLIVDQITKAIVMATIEAPAPYRGDVFFHITHQRNPGLVGGMFGDTRIIAFAAPVIATLVLLFLYRHLTKESRIQSLAYGMVLGGAIGNLVDRVRHQSVTDFLQFHFYFIPFDFPWKYYPAFNVADSCIVVGVAALIITWNIQAPPDAADSV